MLVTTATAIGERLMELRKKRKLSMRELAERSGANTSLISQVETGKTNPTVAKLQNLATALGVPVNYFFDPHDEPPPDPQPLGGSDDGSDGALANGVPVHSGVPLDVVRSYDRETIELSDGVTWERLTPHGRAGIEFLEVTYEMNANSGPLASHYGEEFIHVQQGALEVEFAFNRVVLAPGDSLVFDSTVPHRVTSVGDVPMKAIWVNWTRVGLRGAADHPPAAGIAAHRA
jgi:mannose-6-phosphate isomerase-like protein (cupin superfamily)/DNA-binding XRE family transcriptional regulator